MQRASLAGVAVVQMVHETTFVKQAAAFIGPGTLKELTW